MSVSILIPAFRPTFLREAIASALTQGHKDLEIVISDDSGGDELLPVIEAFRDPRIRYMRTAGRIGAAENCGVLWGEAQREQVMFLFDDDLLLPHAIVEMRDALAAHPGASFAFGRRYIIDKDGRISSDPGPSAPGGLVTGAQVASAILGNMNNGIGEFSNVLINRAVGLRIDDLMAYRDIGMHVVTDVGFYLNATRKGPAVAVGKTVAAFRRHGAQNSSAAFNPKLAIGIVEWELFMRGEYDAGRLTQADAAKGLEKLSRAYGHWGVTLPTISRMAPGLARLRGRVAAGEENVLDDAFRADWDAFVAAVLDR